MAAFEPARETQGTEVAPTAAARGAPAAPDLRRPLQAADALYLQRVAGNAAVARIVTSDAGPSRRVLARHPAEKILKFAGKWLAKRGFQQVSKHIAKHGRNIAGKALHSVFKSPKDIKWLIERTIKEAEVLAAREGKAAAGEVLEDAGVRIERQAMGSGKVRWKIQKAFKSAIGTKGETVLRVIIDQTGRIVTAFPADRMAAIGLGAAGALALEEGTAEAAENLRLDAEEQARKAAEKEDSWGDWEEWIPFLGDIWGGSLNEGEDEYLRQQRHYADVVEDVIKRIEYEEKRTIAGTEREELRDLVRAGIAAPYMVDEAEADAAAQ